MRTADCNYVLERGRIVECGRHEQLLGGMRLYYMMWRRRPGIFADLNAQSRGGILH